MHPMVIMDHIYILLHIFSSRFLSESIQKDEEMQIKRRYIDYRFSKAKVLSTEVRIVMKPYTIKQAKKIQ